MNTTTMVVGTGVLVAAGRWANAQPLDIKIAVGVGVFALALSILGAADEKLAGQFALLVFILACFRYLPGIVQKLGFTGAAK